MDRTNQYRHIVKRIIDDYASVPPSNGDIESEVVVDDKQNHFEIMHIGLDGQRRVHGCVVHVDIKDGKVWVQHDGTSEPIAEELHAAGIPREDIVLGFHPREVRKHTAFAIG